jgi:hypothetical protein
VTPHLPAREVSRIAATTCALLGRSRRARDRLQLAHRQRALARAGAGDRGRAPHSAPLEFGGFDSEFTLEPRGDQVAMTPRAAGFDLPAALPAAEDRRRASAGERA